VTDGVLVYHRPISCIICGLKMFPLAYGLLNASLPLQAEQYSI